MVPAQGGLSVTYGKQQCIAGTSIEWQTPNPAFLQGEPQDVIQEEGTVLAETL